jgi:hypothetical protein
VPSVAAGQELRNLLEGIVSDLPAICYVLLSILFSWRFLQSQKRSEEARKAELNVLHQIELSLADLNARLEKNKDERVV